MKRFLVAAVAAVTASWAGSAAALTVVDFEGYSPGDHVGGSSYISMQFMDGTPHPILKAGGFIKADATPGIGNYLELVQPTNGEVPRIYLRSPRLTDPVTGRMSEYAPRLISFDIYITGGGTAGNKGPGRVDVAADTWTTINVNQIYGGLSQYKFSGAEIRLDNFVFEDRYGAVPEPSTWAMMLAGFGLLGGAIRSRRRYLAA